MATAQSADASQLVQQGVARYQAGDIQGAISQWQTALSAYKTTKSRANEAIVLENLARAYQQLGASDRAISNWEQAIAAYRHLGDFKQVGRMLTEKAQLYSSLGQSKRAIAILCSAVGEPACVKDSALQIARAQKDRALEAAALGSLGDAYRLRGEYRQALIYLQASLKIANEINNSVYRSSALNSLGNAYISLAQVNYRRVYSAAQRGDSAEADKLRQKALNYDLEALKYFQDSQKLAQTQSDVQGEMRTLLNSILPYYRTQASTSAIKVRQQAQSLLERLPDSQVKVYAAIDLAHLLQPVIFDDSANQCLKPELETEAAELLKQAVSIAQRIQDRRSESFALGELGHIYECRNELSRALDLTQQAQWAADQDLLAKDSLYLWEWQAGRILKAQHQKLDALKAYELAFATLESIRGDLLTANRDLQLDFRDAVDPIYRELAELKLNYASQPYTKSVNRTQELSSALSTIDSLKLAELQNYFGNDCVITALNQEEIDLAGVGTETAIFNSIIFKDRTAILVSFPNGEKRFEWIDIDNKSFIQAINEFRRGLERYRDITYDTKQAQKLYDWIVRPFADDLDSAQTKTLVFTQDGILRSIPMAALHDGEKFLIQKYAIATTPSLTLTDSRTLKHQKLRALALGLTKDAIVDGQKFPALTNVGLELNEVKSQIPGSKQLLDGNFTRDRLGKELGETVYPIIHIATHGEFGTDPEDTFLVTGNNGKLTITDLDTAIRSDRRSAVAVELLALTACQTAVGDDRAALGLAGVAVQAGVRSALASLWSIDDAATVTFITKFYTSWYDKGLSKAEALRTAQQALISTGGEYAHPAYWAPFILIGNWL